MDCDKIRNFIDCHQDPLYVDLGPDFDEYFKDTETDARTSYRKAIRNGCTWRKVDKLTPELDSAILDIYGSTDSRQNREINYFYQDLDYKSIDVRNGWPIRDYSIYDCDNHNLEFFICENHTRPVAYLEMLNSNEVSIVRATMGHKDYFKYGIMKFMFLETFKYLIPDRRYVIYGEKKYIENDSRIHFMKDLLITKHGQADFLKRLSKEDLCTI